MQKVAADEQSAYIQTIEWLDNELNEDLPDSDFTLAKLGVKSGDLIHDQLTDAFYYYDGASQDTGSGLGIRHIFVAGNVIVVAILAGVFFWRRHRNAAS